MERLTYTDEELKEFEELDCPIKNFPVVERFCDRVCDEFQSDCPYKNMGKKLKAYEDAEEQGLLLRLPFKVGTKVYRTINGGIRRGWYYIITEFELKDLDLFEMGLMFLTKEEAEQKLERMKGE